MQLQVPPQKHMAGRRVTHCNCTVITGVVSSVRAPGLISASLCAETGTYLNKHLIKMTAFYIIGAALYKRAELILQSSVASRMKTPNMVVSA